MSNFTVPASEYMTSPVVTVRHDASAVEAETVLEDRGITAVGVVDDAGLVGVLSRTDLLNAASGESGETFSVPDVPVSELMTAEPERCAADTPLDEVAKVMLKKRFHRVFVDGNDGVAGVVSTRDIMRAVLDKKVSMPASEIATKKVFSIPATESIALAVERLDKTNRHGLVVVDGGFPVGTFSQLDALLGRARDPRTPVEDAMNLALLVLPHDIALHRAARQALAMNVRRFVLTDADRIIGVVSSFDFCRVVA